MGDANQGLPAYQAQLKADLRGIDLPADLNELASGYRNATKELTALKAQPTLRVPTAEAKPEEVAAFRKAIGVPDTADGYQVKVPDGMPADEVAAFRAAAHKAGYTTAQVAEAIAFYDGSVKRALAAYEKRRTDASSAGMATLKTELAGGDEAKLKGLLDRAVNLVAMKGGVKLKAELENGMGDNPELIKFLVKEVVPLFKEDGSPLGSTVGGRAATSGEPTPQELATAYPNSPGMFGLKKP